MLPSKKQWIGLLQMFLLACVYFGAGRLNLSLYFSEFPVPILWAMTGLSIAVFYLMGRRQWVGIFIGSFWAFFSYFSGSLPEAFFFSLLMASGNTLQPLIGHYLFERYVDQTNNPLHRVSDVFNLLIIAIVVTCINAFNVALWGSAFGGVPWEMYHLNLLGWWLSDALGTLTFLLIFWSFYPRSSFSTSRLSLTEFLAFLFCLLACNAYLFSGKMFFTGQRPFTFLLIPLVVWGGIRFKRLGIAVIAMITSAFAIWGTLKDYGPFGDAPHFQEFFHMHAFLSVITLTGMVICASLKERNALIQKLERIQRRFEQVIESSPYSILIATNEGKIELANKMAETMFGYARTELIGRSVEILVPPRLKTIQHELDLLEAIRAQKTNLELHLLHKDGREIPVEASLNPIEIEGRIFMMVSIADITQRKKADQALKESELHFRTMADNAPVLIWMSNAAGEPIFFNKEWLDFTGRSLTQELAEDWKNQVHPEDMARVRQAFNDAYRTRKKFTLDYRFKKSTGIFRWILNIGVPYVDLNGQFTGYIGSCIDITSHKEAQEVLARDKEMLGKIIEERSLQLLQTQKDLEMINRLADIGTLAATVAHELRNPLGVIEMASYNLKRKNPAFADDKHLLNIEKKVQESNRIINNLLNYSRMKQPKFESVKINSILDECIQAVKDRIDVSSTITLQKKYPPDIELFIEADPYQMREIFYNILTNAHQALEKNTGSIAVDLTAANGSVEITVEDTGVGIEPNDLQRIFEPFFTRKSKGTGLGLAICNELVTFHKGKIFIESQPKIGTRVKVTLPRSRSNYARENSHH